MVSKTGEVEVLAEDPTCSQKIENTPPFNLTDNTARLEGDTIVLEGRSETGRMQLSLDGARGGLLANNWTSVESLGSTAIHKKYDFGKARSLSTDVF